MDSPTPVYASIAGGNWLPCLHGVTIEDTTPDDLDVTSLTEAPIQRRELKVNVTVPGHISFTGDPAVRMNIRQGRAVLTGRVHSIRYSSEPGFWDATHIEGEIEEWVIEYREPA